MTTENSFERFHRRRRENIEEMRRIRDDTDEILSRLEAHAPVNLQDLARLEGLRAQRETAFSSYQGAEDELINARLATDKGSRDVSWFECRGKLQADGAFEAYTGALTLLDQGVILPIPARPSRGGARYLELSERAEIGDYS